MAKKVDKIVENKKPNSVIPTDITETMQKAYLDYAMSVIVSRALPDVRDGLKPVHRRIVYAMQDQGVTFAGRFQKCASVVGEVMKRYHPHGDTAIYDTLVRMGQDFSMRYPLINPQGNFGSVDGDPPAAMRYTECKMQKITEELYRDIDKETVDFELNDLQTMEPVYLPAVLPNLLLNGQEGIAVGMATKIPPHNLDEIIDGISLLIDQQTKYEPKVEEKEVEIVGSTQKLKVAQNEFSSEATVEDLVEHIKGPDFPTGGIIYDKKETTHMYATGKGRVVIRAKMGFEEMKNGRNMIVITELPYQVNKATLLTKIAELVKKKRIEGISDLRDESSRNEIRVIIELKKGAIPKKIENSLYKYTPLQTTFNTNMVALVDGEPKLLTLKMILGEFVRHRQLVVIRRTIFLLKRAKSREHILQGLKIALDNLDAVIKLIRGSKDVETAKAGLMKKFGLTEIQAQAILDMQLRRLAALERQKIEDELKEIIETIEGFEGILISPEKVIKIIRGELEEIKEKYGDERRTRVIKGGVGEISEEDLVVDEDCIITISLGGYIKRIKPDTYRIQGRGGTGVSGGELKEEDQVDKIKICSTHDWAFFLTNKGRVYKLRIWEIPEYSRKAKGTPIVNFLSVAQSEGVEAFLTLTPEELEKGKGFVFFATQKGKAKKTPLDQFANIRSSGIIAIKLSEEDSLVYANVTQGKDDLMLTTSNGQSIRFSEKDVRPMGRSASGVSGIKLKNEEDKVVGAIIIPEGEKDMYLMAVSKNGSGKRTRVDQYKVQKRGGSGILTYKVTQKTGKLVSARGVKKGVATDLLIATESGMVIRVGASQTPILKRDTQGVRLIRLKSGDHVTSVAVIEEENES
ncbi:DNA gyrase subunit A [Patescibacteria group bacterium]